MHSTASQSWSYLQIKIRICIITLLSLVSLAKIHPCFHLHKVFKECYYSILDDLSTLHNQALVYCEHLAFIVCTCNFLERFVLFLTTKHDDFLQMSKKYSFCSVLVALNVAQTLKLLHDSVCQQTIN